MYIILKTDYLLDKKDIVNVMYDFQYDKWMKMYLNSEKSFLDTNEKSDENSKVEYIINGYTLIKKESTINKGYLYDKKTEKQTELLSLEVYTFDANEVTSNHLSENNTRLWENINSEINKRILKTMDKESLNQVFVKVNDNIKLKERWSNYEYTNMLNELLKNFKKELYSSVAKKLKRYKRSH